LEPFIQLNGNTLNRHDLVRSSAESRDRSPFEKSFIACVKKWLGNDSNFTFSTSGSTGTPKPVTFTRAQVKASAQLTINSLSLKPNQTSLICLDTRYVAGQLMVIRSLENGMNLLAVEPCADPLKNIPKGETIDFAAFVPYQLNAILDSSESTDKLNRITCAIIGGASVDGSAVYKIQHLSCALYATYGMTETLTHVALQRLNGASKQDCFQALLGISLSLDERNCLVIEADHLPEKVITNDLVELMDKGRFRWLGRYDNIINSGGIKIIPEKVEALIKVVFSELGIKSRYFVDGLADAKLGYKVVLIIEGMEIYRTDDVLKRIASKLSKYEVPKEIYYVSTFLETGTQKIDRKRILHLLNQKA
jgi:O-succinylbenzoic acid--CoA ligase